MSYRSKNKMGLGSLIVLIIMTSALHLIHEAHTRLSLAGVSNLFWIIYLVFVDVLKSFAALLFMLWILVLFSGLTCYCNMGFSFCNLFFSSHLIDFVIFMYIIWIGCLWYLSCCVENVSMRMKDKTLCNKKKIFDGELKSVIKAPCFAYHDKNCFSLPSTFSHTKQWPLGRCGKEKRKDKKTEKNKNTKWQRGGRKYKGLERTGNFENNTWILQPCLMKGEPPRSLMPCRMTSSPSAWRPRKDILTLKM